MKKQKLVFLILLSLFSIYLVGCNKNETDSLEIKKEQLTQKEKFLFNSMGIYHNYVYKIENIPNDKNYKLLCWSEDYKAGKLVNKDDISNFYINQNNNIDSSLYLVLNLENAPDNTMSISLGTLADVPNSIIRVKQTYTDFAQGIVSSINSTDTNVNQDITVIGFSKAHDSGSDSSIDLSNFQSIEKGIKENNEVRLIKIKLVED